MSALRALPAWTILAPLLGLLLIPVYPSGLATLAVALGLGGAVLAAVHHAEVVAHRVGEPFGTLILALAVTVIETGLIISLMLAATDGTARAVLARDTVFAAVMIILNGMVGLCLLAGGIRHLEQSFRRSGVNAALSTIAAITVLALVLPNYTVSAPGPYYAPSQLAFVAATSLLLYLTFVAVQTVRHRDYFLPREGEPEEHAPPPTAAVARTSAGLLVACLIAVVVLAKNLSGQIEAAVDAADAPRAVVGVIIAALVLLPESLAAYRAARRNRLQTSLNLALGSAVATIGLTIPAVALIALIFDLPLALGLDGKGTVLLGLSLFLTALSLTTGRTTVMQGMIHLVVFAVYLFTTIVP